MIMRETITTSDHCKVTRGSVESAMDFHQDGGHIIRWHNWHETNPGRRRPLYTVTLRGNVTLDIANLWEARAMFAGIMSNES